MAIAVAGLLFNSGCHVLPASFVRDLREYDGDGQIEETTVHSLYSVHPGFRVFLPMVTPSDDKVSVFRVGPFPQTKHGEIGFALLTEPGFDLRRHAEKLALSLELRDQNGVTVYQHEGVSDRFSEPAVYSDAWRDAPYWVFGARFFRFAPNTNYTLHVRYSTREQGFRPSLKLVIWSGGAW
jgi:hypothetical protein